MAIPCMGFSAIPLLFPLLPAAQIGTAANADRRQCVRERCRGVCRSTPCAEVHLAQKCPHRSAQTKPTAEHLPSQKSCTSASAPTALASHRTCTLGYPHTAPDHYSHPPPPRPPPSQSPKAGSHPFRVQLQASGTLRRGGAGTRQWPAWRAHCRVACSGWCAFDGSNVGA